MTIFRANALANSSGTRIVFATIALLLTLTHVAVAEDRPILTVRNGGVSAGNQRWIVEVSPDLDLWTSGSGSLAVELGLEVLGSELVNVQVNQADWTQELPGNNPFSSGVAHGLVSDPNTDTVFAAFGSEALSTADPVTLLTIETLGTFSGSLRWGNYTLFARTEDEYSGSRIAQAGTAFDQFAGILTVGSDWNQNETVNGDDFLGLQRADPAQIDGWQNDYGTNAPGSVSTTAAAVPEPATWLMLVTGLASLAYSRRRPTGS